MEKRRTHITKQDLLDKLSELADLLSAGRRIDPNCNTVKMQLERIQTELQSMSNMSSGQRRAEDNG
ncbi:MAG: hypothetical protein JO301_03575 [Chitinophagaceae bacterium]|nr:hypothetical protein [Chitinophagaceae bacterium]